MSVVPAFWRGKRVLVTGHTGFKGGWLSLWLEHMGAQVTGLALPPETTPSLFETARIASTIDSRIGDVRDRAAVLALMREVRPEIVLHLAAQALVRRSYRDPVETYATNVMGTANVLDAVRQCEGVRACISVTSDKCYENREWLWGYREDEPMGGHDPYSSSKGCAELVTAAYRQSFFDPARHHEHGVALASARAGNVIGGGDWSEDRLVPDVVRAFHAGDTVDIRSPGAVRPWQHVLEPVSGYLLLAQRLVDDGPRFAEGWNFGPDDAGVWTVKAVVEYLRAQWPGGRARYADQPATLHEATLLKLDSSKARLRLGWQPSWTVERALQASLDWYRAHRAGDDMRACTLAQIDQYRG